MTAVPCTNPQEGVSRASSYWVDYTHDQSESTNMGQKKILGKQQQKYILWKYYINVNIYIHTVIHIIVDANKSLYSQPSEIWNNRFTPTTCRPQQPLPAWRVGLVVIHVDDFAVVVNAEGHLCRRMLRFCVFPEGPAKRLQWSQELP